MLDLIIVLTVLGSVAAGLWDLKTTEVPDQLPYAMVGTGILYWGYSWFVTGDNIPLIISLTTGTLLLALGLVMYRKGQWGGADAWVLAGIAYMVPVYNNAIFILPYLMNFVFVSLGYVILYSLFIGFQNRSVVISNLQKDLHANSKLLLLVPAAALLFIGAGSVYSPAFLNFWFFAPLLLALLIFWRYAKVIENNVFRKKISVKKLRTGDVLDKNIWIGLTKEEVAKLRKEKKYVEIKDGIRFVPVFAITLIVTLLEINLFALFLSAPF